MSLLPIEMGAERVELAAPESAIGGEPAVELRNGFGPQRIDAPLPLAPHADQPGLAQQLEMLGNARLADLHRLDDLARRPLAHAQQVEDLPASRIGEHVE